MNQPEQIPNSPPPPPAGVPTSTPAPATATDSRLKSPVMAGMLSAMPGLGQVYVGYYQRGFIHIFVVASIITLLATGVGPLTPLAGLFLAFFWLYNMIDAARRAMLYNRALAGSSEDVELPHDFPTPGMHGSVAGGLTLAAVGVVLLLNTRFDMSLEWLEEWWPAALIIFGGYLVWKAIQDRAQRQSEDSEP